MNKLLSFLCVIYGALVIAAPQGICNFISGVILFMAGAVSFIVLTMEPKINIKLEEKKSHAFFKIVDTIASCTTYKHLQTCRNMIMNYQKLYQKDFELAANEALDLMILVVAKDNEIIAQNANV